jgi:uncharacterized protein (TIGR02757 family)
MNSLELKEFLDYKVDQYNTKSFVEPDPISIPHRYTLKEDIEIAGLLVAIISWGNRKLIVENGHKMMNLIGNSPYDFVMSHKQSDFEKLEYCIYRTLNKTDLSYILKGLKHVYKSHGGIEEVFKRNATVDSLQPAIHQFKKTLFEIPHTPRTQKHIPDPMKGSAAKKINMYLRWMIRKDNKGVDFGIWNSIPQSILSCPLDLHSGNVARKLGLLTRKQDNAKAVLELDISLRKLDSLDPVKYDFALFGLGIFENFR